MLNGQPGSRTKESQKSEQEENCLERSNGEEVVMFITHIKLRALRCF